MIRKMLYSLFIVIINIAMIYSINNYPYILIGTVNAGNADVSPDNGQIRFAPEFINMGGHPPQLITISEKNQLYVSDVISGRFNIYNLNMDFIRTIRLKTLMPSGGKILVDNEENIIGLSLLENHLVKINKNGELIYRINRNNLSIQLRDQNKFYLINSGLLYFDEKSNGIEILDASGIKLTEEEKKEILDRQYNEVRAILLNDPDFAKKYIKDVEDLLSTEKIFFNDGTMIAENFDVCREYYKILKKATNNKAIDRVPDVTNDSPLRIIGFDDDKNSYWNCICRREDKFFIVVCSNKGEIIDTFFSYQQKNAAMSAIAIAPNGDIYYKDAWPENGKFHFYKISWKNNSTRQQPDTTAQSTTPVVTSLTASSYNTYKNMYTPLKAFDGDIKTAWLEAAKGPGIGETITLELDREITVDSIQVLPGYFDAKWWKSNNRVKSLIMKIDDSTTTLQFQDAMKPHKADFKTPKTFKKVEFIIKEVYPSGKDDDTAISEIQFYYKGERIQLDFSRAANQAKTQ